MLFHKKLIALLLLLITLSGTAHAFEVTRVEVKGLKQVPLSQVLKAIPIHPGDSYGDSSGAAIIRALYKTGLFGNVQLGRRGNVLIVHVQERPIISVITIQGNKQIETKRLRSILAQYFKIQEGAVFNPDQFKLVAAVLQEQLYGGQGYHAATVTTRYQQSPGHPGVALTITIDEGPIAKVGAIQFIGNHAFSARKLRDQFTLSTSGLFTIFNHKDRYSPVLLDQDIANLSKFYLNHGYVEFKVLSKKAVLSPDKKKVLITIVISEGPIYHFSGYKVVGEVHGLAPELKKSIRLKAGDLFTYQGIEDIKTYITYALSNRGYGHAEVRAQPKTDQKSHTVYVTFAVSPGGRVYVRRINFIGNTRTDERVLRHELLQYEGSVYSKEKLERSKQLLNFLPAVASPSPPEQPYYEEVPVPDHPDQVDINYHVKEAQTASARLEGAYSSLSGFMYGLSLSDNNFRGSGKRASIGFQNDQLYQRYQFSYVNPYYGNFGLSRGISAYYTRQKENRTKVGISNPYNSDGFGAALTYAYPITARTSLSFGYGYEHININNINTFIAPPSVLAYVGLPQGAPATSRSYDYAKGNASWSYQGLDRGILPTDGLMASVGFELGAPITSGTRGYYIVSSTMQYYLPLWHDFIFNLSANVAYGGGLFGADFPFFKNFYAGGIGSVPAFFPNSLGPKNVLNQNGAIGGNLLTVFGAHLILPPFISDKVRTAIIFDAGNIFQSPRSPADLNYLLPNGQPQIIQNDTVSLSNLRYSLGVGVTWLTFVPISVSIAAPINKKPGDETQLFQFVLSAGL